ncbi:3-deoxy-D-manno-octulosonic acid transferase [Rhodoferax antarcticus]|uniref:3-deoxy-D-manno-octulosonic acid transferase n=2 Tax=Rhodoferax antarcticus TaxID=81479 RepID=A0A1Q8YA07_9BURK|nr:3-deoxy-D-manno-octulosonic acid transferase [Rhodoferax antarcticus]APW46989.1 3-deoxy-D-manno-octulosonic acid transferase [Rhodoferax antarcticus]OLP04844.1 3-deoxy-D-manno-octulosonic-acid transferase family protein [Rhodoferax antarcticus ANT.BR]
MWLAQPLLTLKLKRRGQQEPGYLHAMDERFGRYTSPVPAHDGPTVWIHAVSLGETRAAMVLVAALRDQIPDMRLLLTHGTATGRAEGVKLLQPGDLQAWQPWDTVGATQRFLKHFRPKIGVLMETEIWPNLVSTCHARQMPLVLANARLSEKSLRQAQKLSWLARPAFAGLNAVWPQTQADAQRLNQLDAPVRAVFGNLKFDANPDMRQIALGRTARARIGKPVVMFASSREGEELALLQILKAFRPPAHIDKAQAAINNVVSDIQWLIVPRHPQRVDAVAELITEQGFSVSRRSSWGAQGPATPAQSALDAAASVNSVAMSGLDKTAAGDAVPTIWLGDSLGEMALYYGLADVALLGGSFKPLGGQNLIEAAACGCPVLMGPHTFNFADAAEQALAAGAALRVADLAQAVSDAAEVVVDAKRLATARQACDDFSQAHRGATQLLARAILHVMIASVAGLVRTG